jgi:transposase
MWGTSSPDDRLTGDLGNGIAATQIRGRRLDPVYGGVEQAIAKAEAIAEKTQVPDAPRKRRINRGALPAHLPRIHETVAPTDSNCPCCRRRCM